MKQSLEEKQSLAMEGLAAGKNCGQLVLLAYQEELNLPEELLLPLSAGLIEGLGTSKRQLLYCINLYFSV